MIDVAGITLSQSDPRWRGRLLGRSTTTTIGAAGCLVTAVAIAERALGHRAGSTPIDVQTRGLVRPGVWAAGAAGAVAPELIRAQGLRVGGDYDGAGRVASTVALREAIAACLIAGGVAVVCVDHDRHRPGGDEVGDHWGTIVEVDDDAAWLSDPATCDVERLVWRTLTGVVDWSGRAKPYTVTRAITVYRP